MSHNRCITQQASPTPVFWNVPERDMHLPPGHVHVWRAMIAPPLARLQAYQDTVSPDERERAQRLILPEHRRRFTAARGMLRHILGRYIRTPPRDIRFGVGHHGKPFLQYPASQPLHFNVAHSQQCAVYAVSRDFEVGIDLEGDREHADYLMLAKRICSPEEFTTFQQLPQDKHKAAFFSCWTRKEAVVKAEGKGLLVLPLKQLTVSFAPDEPPHVLSVRGQVSADHQWSLVTLPMEQGFWGALAINGQPDLVQGWNYDLDDMAFSPSRLTTPDPGKRRSLP